jgi:hypothetical protein
MPLFEVAIIQQPTKKEIEDGTGAEKLLFGPKAVLAKDNQTAGITAILAEGAALQIDMARAQVIVRPFG